MRPLVMTYGMGIGAEIALKALPQLLPLGRPLVLMGRQSLLVEESQRLGLSFAMEGVSTVFCEDGDEPAEIVAIRQAALGCRDGQYAAMTTGPINKAILIDQGFAFKGHTDFLADIFDTPTVMAFWSGGLQVVLMTTHIPLKDVPSHLSIEGILQTVSIADGAWYRDLGIKATFAVCGLNPHAGEKGKLGDEEIRIIAPACDLLRERGVNIVGPISAETAFLMAKKKEVDVVVAMYHDQGLAPLKLMSFGESVNWTLGLPIIRSSVDHGTADDIVGQGIADESSMIAAVQLAHQIVSKAELHHSLSEMLGGGYSEL